MHQREHPTASSGCSDCVVMRESAEQERTSRLRGRRTQAAGARPSCKRPPPPRACLLPVPRMAAPEWQIGSRVLVAPENDVATVRYVGAVAGTDGEWVGVEFDTAGRGKHDGMHQGVRYFACSAAAGAQAASFVRPHKLRRGVTLLEALVTKYEQRPRLLRAPRERRSRTWWARGAAASWSSCA